MGHKEKGPTEAGPVRGETSRASATKSIGSEKPTPARKTALLCWAAGQRFDSAAQILFRRGVEERRGKRRGAQLVRFAILEARPRAVAWPKGLFYTR